MKKLGLFVLFLGLIASLSACGKAEITMQEIYDANQTEALLENHESVYIQDEMGGKVFRERYLTKEYAYEHFPDEEFNFVQFTTDDANYAYSSGDYLRYLYIAPDGVTNDFASDRAERYESVFGEESVDEIIESATNKDGRITVNSCLSEEVLAKEGLTYNKNEYVLDAKTYELISAINDYTYGDGEELHLVVEAAYDAEAPEMLEVFLKYEDQTEDLRNVTIVSNPGTEKEISQDFRIPKGLIVGFTWADAFEDKVELYSDAACTESYDPYVNTDSDLTVYVKWNA